MPTEIFLASYYSTSRMTVHKAVQSLAVEGLVERRPKIGTVVTARARERPVFEIWDAADTFARPGDITAIVCSGAPWSRPYLRCGRSLLWMRTRR